MGQTSNPTIRYPDANQRPMASQLKNLAEDVHSAFTADTPVSDYTPVWRNSANAQLAVGNGTFAGKYRTFGKLVWVAVHFTRGSTTNVGDAQYKFDLPFSGSALAWVNGFGAVFQGAGTTPFPVTVVGMGGNQVSLISHKDTNYVGGTLPGGWLAGGYIRFSCMYERV